MITMTPAEYRALVAARRAYGDRLFGQRHLHQDGGQLRRMTTEVADCHVYLTLELDSRRHLGVLTGEHEQQLQDLLERTATVGETAAAAARVICDPTIQFSELRAARWQYGADKHADSYVGRDNVVEALEELADAEIFTQLQAERLRYRDHYPDEIRDVLVEVLDDLQQLALAIASADLSLTSDVPVSTRSAETVTPLQAHILLFLRDHGHVDTTSGSTAREIAEASGGQHTPASTTRSLTALSLPTAGNADHPPRPAWIRQVHGPEIPAAGPGRQWVATTDGAAIAADLMPAGTGSRG